MSPLLSILYDHLIYALLSNFFLPLAKAISTKYNKYFPSLLFIHVGFLFFLIMEEDHLSTSLEYFDQVLKKFFSGFIYNPIFFGLFLDLK